MCKEEEEFMCWWTAEEEQLRKETPAKPSLPVSPPTGSNEGRRGGKRNRSGRGRGKDKERGVVEPLVRGLVQKTRRRGCLNYQYCILMLISKFASQWGAIRDR